MFNTIVGVGAASRYGSDQMMRLQLRNTGFMVSLTIDEWCCNRILIAALFIVYAASGG
jgi:hypothetical protein